MNHRFLTDALITRRTTLKALAGLSAAALAGCKKSSATAPGEMYLSAQGRDDAHFALSWINQQHNAASVLSGFRGHGAAQHPLEPWRVVMYSRHPGIYAMEVDIRSGQITHRIESPEGHCMHGHGAFSADGQWMYSTESDYRSGEGKILVRDSRNYQLAGEFSTHGMGPHQMLMMPDQHTLAIANGGLRTHPDKSGEILNLDTMDSSLVYINSASGELTGQYRLDEKKASIRHLDVAPDGTVAIATQVQRRAMSNDKLVLLAALHKPGSGELMPLHAPDSLMSKFNDYMGSVAISQHERIAGFTSPRGNLAAFWHLDSGELAGFHAFHDVCGLTTAEQGRYFVLSNSAGEVRYINALSLQEERNRRQQFAGMHWDNHMFTFNIRDLNA